PLPRPRAACARLLGGGRPARTGVVEGGSRCGRYMLTVKPADVKAAGHRTWVGTAVAATVRGADFFRAPSRRLRPPVSSWRGSPLPAGGPRPTGDSPQRWQS